MKYILILLSFMICAPIQAATFIEGLEDVPIMTGMTQIPNDTLSFGNEESRLIEVILEGKKAAFGRVGNFYKTTLPQMGWIYQGKRARTFVFEREGEIMEISKEAENPLRVRITVKSKM